MKRRKSSSEGYETSDSGGIGGIEYYINPRRGWRRLDFDQAQSFLTGFVYDLPSHTSVATSLGIFNRARQ